MLASQVSGVVDEIDELLPAAVIGAIASRESRDVVHNIEVLDAIASVPAPIKTSM